MIQLQFPTQESPQTTAVGPLIFRIATGISNAYFVRLRSGDFVLIDAGMAPCAGKILNLALDLFGPKAPRAILLTHAHFDHAGGLPELLRFWPDTPVYAHRLELPYLNDGVRYPPGDPTVGGVMAEMSRFMDTSKPTRLPVPVQPFPETDAHVDYLPGWHVRLSPGHTPGHVSFWNPDEGILIAGDAIVTMNSNNPLHLLSGRPVISGPPPYATYNWEQARQSAIGLAGLKPLHLCTGHGPPAHGSSVPAALAEFAAHFPIPSRGRYVAEPARFDDSGPLYIPPPGPDYVKYGAIAAGVVAGAIGVTLLTRKLQGRRQAVA